MDSLIEIPGPPGTPDLRRSPRRTPHTADIPTVTSHEDILIYHVKEKHPELEQAPVIGELFQLHAILVKSSMIGFPGILGHKTTTPKRHKPALHVATRIMHFTSSSWNHILWRDKMDVPSQCTIVRTVGRSA
jgi:hypothetical protein